MNLLDKPRLGVVMVGGTDPHAVPPEARSDIAADLLARGFSVTVASANGAARKADEDSLLVLGLFDDNMPRQAEADGSKAKVLFRSIAGLSADQVGTLVEDVVGEVGLDKPGGWKPWFPVIDYDRCTNCMQCLSFCLFDVYGVDEKEQITVRNQEKCKTDCPACSRVCPEVAILFPKYGKGPINGDVVRESDVQREAMKVDVSALLGGNIYESLRNRQSDARKRFSTERDESRALIERRKCLKKLQTDLDIPDEVLMSLPSAGDIQERAERAREKAVKRRQRSQTVQDQTKTPTVEEWGI